MELVEEPFQHQCVSNNLASLMVVGILYSFLHVIVGYGVLAPSAILHQVVGNAAIVNDDLLCGQIVKVFHKCSFSFLVSNAVCEYLDDAIAKLSILSKELCVHAAHQVGTSVLHIVQNVLEWLELDFEWNVQFLENEF